MVDAGANSSVEELLRLLHYTMVEQKCYWAPMVTRLL